MGVMNRIMNFIGLQEEEEVIERERVLEPAEEVETGPADIRKNKGNIVSIHSQKNMKVIICEPRQYDETQEIQEIADHLRSRRSVVVNLHKARPDQGLRIVDFLSGTVYALNGTISRVGPNIFLCTPDTVDIQGGISDFTVSEE
ncbi:cell division protein SepF [Gorillibacterium sp. sgz5001074]|uniref:cell division protein SepF n=1 Tax=Gorillibacterium sp. sgz5001074 TaxID=3446695 RepID=UPI003F67A04A